MRRLIVIITLFALSACKQDRKHLFVRFDSAEGLTSESSVSSRGLKIGQVNDFSFAPDDKVVVKIQFEETPEIPSDSKFIIESDLLGDSDIEVELGESQQMLSSGDTVDGFDRAPLFDEVKTINPKSLFETLTGTSKQDSLLIELRRLNENLEELKKK